VYTEDSYVIAEESHDLAVIIEPKGLGEPGGTSTAWRKSLLGLLSTPHGTLKQPGPSW
jgi:hypothetical protein